MSEPYGDHADLRSGPDLHPDLLPLLPLVGVWQGTGKGGYPTIEDFDYGQRISFSHDGRPFLRYESVTWIIDAAGRFVRPAAREVGWWRPGEGDEFEVLLATQTGIVEIFVGRANTPTQWELSSDVVARTRSAKEVTAEHRLYAVDLAAVGQPLQPHLSARLARAAG